MQACMHMYVWMYGWMERERERDRARERERERERDREKQPSVHYWHAHKYRHILAYLGGAVEGRRNLEPEVPDDR